MIATLFAAAVIAPSWLGIRVDGTGYLRLVRQGRVVYAKQARIQVQDGHLVAEGGARFLPDVASSDSSGLKVDLMGRVSTSGGACGRLVLAQFSSDGDLRAENGFLIASTRPDLGDPGDGTWGVIRMDGSAAAGPQVKVGATETSAAAPAAPTATTKANLPPGKIGEILVSAHSEAAGDAFTLADIAQIKGDASEVQALSGVEIGRTPVMGVTRIVNESQIETGLRAAKLNPDQFLIEVPDRAEVVRTGQTVSSDQLYAAANAAAVQQFGGVVTFVLENAGSELRVAPGELTLTPESCSRNREGVSVVLAVNVNGQHVASRVVTLAPNGGGVGVRTGQSVKVSLKSGGASVVVTGICQSDAWVGEQVTVTITNSAGKRVQETGTVKDANSVEVKL